MPKPMTEIFIDFYDDPIRDHAEYTEEERRLRHGAGGAGDDD